MICKLLLIGKQYIIFLYFFCIENMMKYKKFLCDVFRPLQFHQTKFVYIAASTHEHKGEGDAEN